MPTPPPRPRASRADRVPVLLGTQALFNVGFYAVVPFLALVLTDDFGLAATAVGLVLGVRTFAQQGMFLVGGVLADRFGARRMILLGCAVRVSGFAALAGSLLTPQPTLPVFVVGTVLTGLGGALFSPGLNVLVGAAESGRRPADRARASLFAWLSVTGELGAVIGPLVGAALLGWGFTAVALAGAAFFVAIGVFLFVALPRPAGAHGLPAAGAGRQALSAGAGKQAPSAGAGSQALSAGAGRQTTSGVVGNPVSSVGAGNQDLSAGTENHASSADGGRWWALRDRTFVGFSALHAADLLAYNQLYLALPLALARTDAGAPFVAAMFAWASALTLLLQLPVSRWCAHVGPAVALRVGYTLSALGFAAVAGAGLVAVDDAGRIVAVFVAASLIIAGHLTTNPTALGLAPRFAGALPTGSFFGLLATCGGIAVLVGNLVAGALFTVPPIAEVAPWVFLAVPLAVAALLAPRLARRAGTGVAPEAGTPRARFPRARA